MLKKMKKKKKSHLAPSQLKIAKIRNEWHGKYEKSTAIKG